MNDEIKSYFSTIGKLGGKAKTPAKTEAAKRNLAKAIAALTKTEPKPPQPQRGAFSAYTR